LRRDRHDTACDQRPASQLDPHLLRHPNPESDGHSKRDAGYAKPDPDAGYANPDTNTNANADPNSNTDPNPKPKSDTGSAVDQPGDSHECSDGR
jgi:hypothetical protein